MGVRGLRVGHDRDGIHGQAVIVGDQVQVGIASFGGDLDVIGT